MHQPSENDEPQSTDERPDTPSSMIVNTGDGDHEAENALEGVVDLFQGVDDGDAIGPSNNPKYSGFGNTTGYGFYDSFKFRNQSTTGCVGLSNQGATCYMNSLLQSLYMTPEFRSAVYSWEYDKDKDGPLNECIPHQLQLLFAKLQLSKSRAIETKDLTASFGWTASDSFSQHDVQELNRVLFDALESSWTDNSDFFKTTYGGVMLDMLKCLNCNRTRIRDDTYFDIPLVIRGIKTLDEAMHNFLISEKLEGDNQYECEHCEKKVDALKGLGLKTLPKILTIQLKRFDYDFSTMRRVKLNNEVRFPMFLDVSEFFNPDGILTEPKKPEEEKEVKEEEKEVKEEEKEVKAEEKEVKEKGEKEVKAEEKEVKEEEKEVKEEEKEVKAEEKEVKDIEMTELKNDAEAKPSDKLEVKDTVTDTTQDDGGESATKTPEEMSQEASDALLAQQLANTPEDTKELSQEASDALLAQQLASNPKDTTDDDDMPDLIMLDDKPPSYSDVVKGSADAVGSQSMAMIPYGPQSESTTKKDDKTDKGKDELSEEEKKYFEKIEGENVYELFAVLIHRGSAIGGHYHCLIKNFKDGKWMDMNDSNVDYVEEVSVKNTWGGGSSYSGSNAYMLVYRKTGEEIVDISDAMVPKRVADIVLDENREFEGKKAAYELHKDDFLLRVFYGGKEYKIPMNNKHKFKDALVTILDTVGLKGFPEERVRLRSYRIFADAPAQPFEPESDSVDLGTLGFDHVSAVMVETREADAEFPEWREDDVLYHIHPFIDADGKVGDPVKVTISKTSNLEAFREKVAQALSWPANKTRIFDMSFGVDELPFSKNDQLLYSNLRIYEGDTLHAELKETDDPDEPSRVVTRFEETKHIINIRYNVPGTEVADHKLSFDQRKTLADLRNALAAAVDVEESKLVTRRTHVRGPELKRLDAKLSELYLTEGSIVCLAIGTPTKPGYYQLSFVVRSPGTDHDKKEFQIPLHVDSTIKDAKIAVCKRLEMTAEEFSLIRLREQYGKKMSTVHRDEQTLRQALQHLYDGRDLTVQILPEPEHLEASGCIATVLCYSDILKKEPKYLEIMCPRNPDSQTLVSLCATKVGYDPLNTLVARPSYSGQELNSVSMGQLNWHSYDEKAEEHLKDSDVKEDKSESGDIELAVVGESVSKNANVHFRDVDNSSEGGDTDTAVPMEGVEMENGVTVGNEPDGKIVGDEKTDTSPTAPPPPKTTKVAAGDIADGDLLIVRRMDDATESEKEEIKKDEKTNETKKGDKKFVKIKAPIQRTKEKGITIMTRNDRIKQKEAQDIKDQEEEKKQESSQDDGVSSTDVKEESATASDPTDIESAQKRADKIDINKLD